MLGHGRSMKNFAGFLVTLVFSSQLLAWGATGHQIVAYVGASLATEGLAFWQANADGMRQLSTVPDRVWKSLPTSSTEKPNHFFQADAYVADINSSELMSFPKSYADAVTKYGDKTVVVNGTAPWRIRQFYKLATAALQANDASLALQYAGVMSHYIGDLSQPLHVSENFNGQLTGNSGIHSYFETTILKNETQLRADVMLRAKALLKDPAFLAQFNSDLSDTVLSETSRSIRFRDQILQTDTRLGRSAAGAAAQLELAKDRMADGAATMAIVLSHLWKDGGQNLNASPIAVMDPAWVAPVFASVRSTAEDDDCEQ